MSRKLPAYFVHDVVIYHSLDITCCPRKNMSWICEIFRPNIWCAWTERDDEKLYASI